ncbi:hypothetical protein C7S14_8190 [Burkholderia cepacia]|nr:hypothetical protein C7S14_8190 [Burkholderia cepacia]
MIEHVLHEQHRAIGRHAIRQRIDVKPPVALQRRREHTSQRARDTRAEMAVRVGEDRERRAAVAARERDTARHQVRDGGDIDEPRAVHDVLDFARELQERQPRQQRATCAQQRAARDEQVGEAADGAGGRVNEGVVLAHDRHCADAAERAEEAPSSKLPVPAFADRKSCR